MKAVDRCLLPAESTFEGERSLKAREVMNHWDRGEP